MVCSYYDWVWCVGAKILTAWASYWYRSWFGAVIELLMTAPVLNVQNSWSLSKASWDCCSGEPLENRSVLTIGRKLKSQLLNCITMLQALVKTFIWRRLTVCVTRHRLYLLKTWTRLDWTGGCCVSTAWMHLMDAFLSLLEWVCWKRGCYFQRVNPSGTSQTCPECKACVSKPLSEREHLCPECGYRTHRDCAAARMVLLRGLESVVPVDNGEPLIACWESVCRGRKSRVRGVDPGSLQSDLWKPTPYPPCGLVLGGCHRNSKLN